MHASTHTDECTRVHGCAHAHTRTHARATALQLHTCPRRVFTPADSTRLGWSDRRVLGKGGGDRWVTGKTRAPGPTPLTPERPEPQPRHSHGPPGARRAPPAPSRQQGAGQGLELCPGGRRGLRTERGSYEGAVTRGERPAEARPRVRSAPSALGNDEPPDQERGPPQRWRTLGSPCVSGLVWAAQLHTTRQAKVEGRTTLAWRSGSRRL